MAAQPGDKMTLDLDAKLQPSPEGTGYEEYSVVVTVKGPPESPKKPSRPGPGGPSGPSPGVGGEADGRGVDLVAVLDISDNMTVADKLEEMQDAMYVVIKKLGEGDRLSIVSFNHTAKQVLPLGKLTDAHRKEARSVVKNLQAGGDAKGGGEDTAKSMATEILEKRTEEEQKDRVGRVIFLSKGDDDTDAEQTKKTRHATTAESFLWAADGLTALTDDDAKSSVAVAAGKQSVEMMAPSMRGLKSVDTGKTVQIDVHAIKSVEISCIESGSNGLSLSDKARKGISVVIPGLRAGEHKSFTVFLTVHEPTTTTDILYVVGWCNDPKGDKDDKFDEKFFNVKTPSTSSEKTVTPDKKPPLTEKTKVTPADVDVPSSSEVEVSNALHNVPNNEKATIESKEQPPNEVTPVFQVIWHCFLNKVQIVLAFFKTIKWSKNYSRALALLLLLGIGAAMLLNWINRPHPPPPIKKLPVQPPPPVTKLPVEPPSPVTDLPVEPPSPVTDLPVETTQLNLDISQHPNWPKMEESIASFILKKMEEASITSSLLGASVEEITTAMNKNIYQALVHNTGLHVALLKETVETLEAEKQELRVNVEKLAKEKKEKVEKKEAVERANDTIADLERQLAAVLDKEAT